jgi:hypothetical protein
MSPLGTVMIFPELASFQPKPPAAIRSLPTDCELGLAHVEMQQSESDGKERGLNSQAKREAS